MNRSSKRYPDVISAAVPSSVKRTLDQEALIQNISMSELIRTLLLEALGLPKEEPYYIYATEEEADYLSNSHLIECAE